MITNLNQAILPVEVLMSLRKVRDAEEARSLLAQVAASGVPRAVFARRHGVDPRSLNAWRLVIERAARSAGELRLVEWVAGGPPAPSFVVRVGQYAVEVDPSFDPHALRRLLTVVASC